MWWYATPVFLFSLASTAYHYREGHYAYDWDPSGSSFVELHIGSTISACYVCSSSMHRSTEKSTMQISPYSSCTCSKYTSRTRFPPSRAIPSQPIPLEVMLWMSVLVAPVTCIRRPPWPEKSPLEMVTFKAREGKQERKQQVISWKVRNSFSPWLPYIF